MSHSITEREQHSSYSIERREEKKFSRPSPLFFFLLLLFFFLIFSRKKNKFRHAANQFRSEWRIQMNSFCSLSMLCELPKKKKIIFDQFLNWMMWSNDKTIFPTPIYWFIPFIHMPASYLPLLLSVWGDVLKENLFLFLLI